MKGRLIIAAVLAGLVSATSAQAQGYGYRRAAAANPWSKAAINSSTCVLAAFSGNPVRIALA